MVFIAASLLLAAAAVLPSAMGLKLDTPATSASEGAIAVTWTTVKTDPKFTLILQNTVNKEGIDVATGIDPTTLKSTVNLGAITPGTYTLQAVNADDIEVALDTTGAFTITAPSAAGNAAGGGAAADTAAAAATTAAATAAATATDAAATCPPPVTVTVTAGAGATATAAAAATASKGKGGKAFGKGAAKGAKKGGRSLFSAKFGRRELYRD